MQNPNLRFYRFGWRAYYATSKEGFWISCATTIRRAARVKGSLSYAEIGSIIEGYSLAKQMQYRTIETGLFVPAGLSHPNQDT